MGRPTEVAVRPVGVAARPVGAVARAVGAAARPRTEAMRGQPAEVGARRRPPSRRESGRTVRRLRPARTPARQSPTSQATTAPSEEATGAIPLTRDNALLALAVAAAAIGAGFGVNRLARRTEGT